VCPIILASSTKFARGEMFPTALSIVAIRRDACDSATIDALPWIGFDRARVT
jgi:hypothetical protein